MHRLAAYQEARGLLGSALIGMLLISTMLWAADSGGYKTPAEREAEIADAVKKNGEILVDWPKPLLTFVFSGEMDGYIEPCGCAGLDNQLGGLKRRHTFLKKLEADGWNPVALDMGGLMKRTGLQQEIKYRYALRGLIELGYDVLTFGAKDLKLSSEAILYALANMEGDANPLVSANINFYDMAKPFRIVEAGGKKIGITAVLGEGHRAELADVVDVEITDAVGAVTKVLPELEATDLKILLLHGSPEEAQELARQFPQFDFIGTTGGAEEPPARAKAIDGTNAYLIESGKKGQYVIAIGVYDNPEEPFKYQRVPLDHRFEDSPEMQQLLVDYQQELETTTLAGLGLTGVKHPEDSFAGSQVCGDCHTQAMAVFEQTPHAHATETLLKLDPQRHHDPECLSCHVTGWNPQEYFPYISGFMGMKESPLMVGNGCENCHGPAAAHVAAESGEETLSDEEMEQLRAALRLKIGPNEGNMEKQNTGKVVDMCLQCHDLDNSPDFDFQKYWPDVKHEGKD